MSLAERKMLYKDWTTSALAQLGANQPREFARLMRDHERAQDEFEDLRVRPCSAFPFARVQDGR